MKIPEFGYLAGGWWKSRGILCMAICSELSAVEEDDIVKNMRSELA